MTSLKKLVFPIVILMLALVGCRPNGVFEKNISIPEHAWNSQFKPSIQFTVEDTTSLYRIYVVFRHTDAYRYKNVWMTITVQPPGDFAYVNRKNLTLATDERGWLGSGMDDIFEHRILLDASPSRFPKKGVYTFTLAQIMREDPLEHVMNAGIRIEKVTN